jgi:hypothetical protein
VDISRHQAQGGDAQQLIETGKTALASKLDIQSANQCFALCGVLNDPRTV